jgi:hypothetical protein
MYEYSIDRQLLHALNIHYFLLILILLPFHFTHSFLYSFVDGTAFDQGT